MTWPTRILSLMLAALLLTASPAVAALITGTVFNARTGEPIPRVTIRIEGTGRSMLGNDDGAYRVRLEPGHYSLRFSHVAHYSQTIAISVTDTGAARDVILEPSVIELPGTTVSSRAYGPGQRIILEAIKRKAELLSRVADYRFDAYTRLTVRKIKNGEPDDFMLLTETQLEGYFQRPDRYKEIITARRQSSNLKAEGNLVTVGEIFNFNANRVEFGLQAVVSPTATDALDYYNYYLLDTVLVDGRPAFRLEIEPKGNAHPLFAGEILIADSQYAVAGVDVGVNEAFDAPYISGFHYTQRYARFDDDIWMPVEILFGGVADLPIPGIPNLSFNYTAALNLMVFNRGIPSGTFDEYVIEVAETADDVDTAAWEAGALVPLTVEETDGYRHIDSVENRPPSIPTILLMSLAATVYTLESPRTYDYFHFNRVEGPYLGAGFTLKRLLPRTDFYLKSGYAFDGEYWQHNYRLTHTLSPRRRLRASFGFHDEIVALPAVQLEHKLNPTMTALVGKMDPLDYYLEKGFDFEITARSFRHSRIGLAYHDLNQYTVANATDYGLFGGDRQHRPNPKIINGKLRSLELNWVYDSRPLIKRGHEEDTLGAVNTTRISAGLELAAPDLIDNDFDYRRYYLSLRRSQRLSGLGITSVVLYAGASDRGLPPQRYFLLDNGDADNIHTADFKTLDDSNIYGDRVLAAYLGHDFGTTLFRKSNLPLLRDFPFTLLIYGGIFWTDFRAASLKAPGEPEIAAPDGYSEIGFGFGRLPPLFGRLYFTWQLTTYDTERFSVKFGFNF